MIFFWILTGIALFNLFTAVAAFKVKHVKKLKKFPPVTIICRTWDDDHVVDRFIKGCLRQNYKGKIQIIIADDASDDTTPEIVKKYAGKIIYVRSEKHHKWKALFLNKIIKEKVTGEILINTDIDAVLPKNYVKEMVRTLQTCDAASSVCVGGNPDTLISRIRIIEDLWLFSTTMKATSVLTDGAGIYGGSHAVWMHVLRDVGYYGTKTMTEDAELTATLNQKGYRIGFCDRTVVILEDVETLSHFLNERKRWIYGLVSMMHHYRDFNLSNLVMSINSLLSTTALISAILSLFNPLYLIPFGLSFLSIFTSAILINAKTAVYFWLLPYLLFDPILELLAIVGIIYDSTFGKGVKWIKISGSKYHIGSRLVPIFKKRNK